jgi:hypothetical protein
VSVHSLRQEAYAVFLFIKLVYQFGGGEQQLKQTLRGGFVEQVSCVRDRLKLTHSNVKPWPMNKCMAPSPTDGQ